MVNTIPYYRLNLTERIRKHLGINLKNKKIYVFKVNHKTYLSVDAIPKHAEFKILTVKLGYYRWYINIPTPFCEYEPTGYKLLNTSGRVLELTQVKK